MDKLKKKKKRLSVASRGWIGRNRVTKKCYCVFLDLNPEMALHSSWSPPTLATVQCPRMDTWPQGNHRQFWQSQSSSLLFSPQRCWLSAWDRPPGICLQTLKWFRWSARFQSCHPVEFELRDTETTVSGGGHWTRTVMMLGPEAIWGQMPSEWLEDIAWGVEEQERQKEQRDLCSWISNCSRPTILHFISPWKWKSLSHVQLLKPHGLYSPWNSSCRNTGVGSLSLFQGISPTQGSNPGPTLQVDSLPAEP